VVDAKENPVRYGFDFGGLSTLPPNTSVIFSVPVELLRGGRRVFVSYNFAAENATGELEQYGKARELRLSEENFFRIGKRSTRK
jgi:hypothetical protein